MRESDTLVWSRGRSTPTQIVSAGACVLCCGVCVWTLQQFYVVFISTPITTPTRVTHQRSMATLPPTHGRPTDQPSSNILRRQTDRQTDRPTDCLNKSSPLVSVVSLLRFKCPMRCVMSQQADDVTGNA
mmetsp:Transcript_26965/g.77417  ORF Transcript_26965/g.77417 Transcript_26965/m.77417 type:complete len:129 (-) Transcript_26965:289-675(-)